MSPGFILDASLLGVSATLVLVMAIAWLDFERPRHALTWSLGFALLSFIWAIRLGVQFGWLAEGDVRVPTMALGALASAVNTIGFRQRALQPPRSPVLLAAALLPPLAAVLLGKRGESFCGLAPLDLFDAIMFALAATTLVGRRKSERTAQRTAYIGLVALAAGSALLFAWKMTALALGVPAGLPLAGTVLFSFLPATVAGVGLFTIFLLTADLADQTRRLAATDMLSGLLNRRGFEAPAQALLDAAAAAGRSVALVLVDIDHFKAVNDGFGHPAGDEVIRRLGHLLTTCARQRDLLARIGGEEFALMIADADSGVAARTAERIRAAVAEASFDFLEGGRVTASFGVAELETGAMRLSDLLARADSALYEAKAAGRNRVVTYLPPEVRALLRPASSGAMG